MSAVEQSTVTLLLKLSEPNRKQVDRARLLQGALDAVEERREEVFVDLVDENARQGERLTELRSQLAEATQWFSVEEEMPDADTTVLMHHPAWDEPVEIGYWDGAVWRNRFDEDCSGAEEPTHWRHFPEPPRTEGEVAQ